MKVIGIDIGTTSICAVSVDTKSAKVYNSITRSSEAFIKSDNSWEKIQDVDKIISLAMEIIEELVDEDVAAIGVTGQMHGIVYTDADGNAVSPLYTWQDLRGNLEYNGTTYAKYLNSYAGYGNVTDFYNRQNGIAPKDAYSYCTIMDYLVMKLTGRNKALIHSTNAASLGMYDIEKKAFDFDCDLEITDEFEVAGYYKDIPVSVAIGDNQASVFSTLIDEENILLNVGTGSQISLISDKIIKADNLETRPYFDGKYLIVGAALCGGRAYSLLKDFYSKIVSYVKETDDDTIYRVMEDMVKDMDGCSINVDTRFAGTRSNPSQKASISGLTTENFTPSEVTMGVLCGMADELKEMYLNTGLKKSGIVGSGNGVRKNKKLVEIFEKVFDSSLKIPSHTEEASYGAAMFAMIASGICENLQDVYNLVSYI